MAFLALNVVSLITIIKRIINERQSQMKLNELIRKAKLALASNKAKMVQADQRAMVSMLAIGVCLLAIAPGLAIAGGGPWDSAAAQVLAIFTGGLTRTLAIIAVIACGIAAIAGKLSWDWAIKIIIGIVLIFGSTAIVNYVIAAAS
jgi:type IV secretory pathway VirB2 component (pilin)